MIPQTDDLIQDVTLATQPSYTYAMTSERVVGSCQGIQAMEQAISKILSTERYQNVIYSWNYGVEFAELIGKPTSFCVPEIERRIKEALLQDDRISEVTDFVFSFPQKRTILVQFTVITTEGNVKARKEVSI